MLTSADAMFFQSPNILFQSYYFKEFGALFFRDRTLYKPSEEMLNWLNDIMPTPPSAYSQTFRIINSLSNHEQESGVVLVNKNTNLLGLLATCLLNVEGDIRDYVYELTHGDKETFWIAFEAIKEPYIFYPSLPGATGIAKTGLEGEHEICGKQLTHFDSFGNPIWLNGGISTTEYRKLDKNSKISPMTHFGSEPGTWKLGPNNIACFKRTVPAIEFSAHMQQLIKKSGQIMLDELKKIPE